MSKLEETLEEKRARIDERLEQLEHVLNPLNMLPLNERIAYQNEQKTLQEERKSLPVETVKLGTIYGKTVEEIHFEQFVVYRSDGKWKVKPAENSMPLFHRYSLRVITDSNNRPIEIRFEMCNSETDGQLKSFVYDLVVDQPVPVQAYRKREPEPELKTWTCNCGTLWSVEQLQCPRCRMVRDREAEKTLEQMLGTPVDKTPINAPLEPIEEPKEALLDKVKKVLK